MAQIKLNRMLKHQIDELKLLATKSDVPVRFILDKTSFNDEEPNDLTELKERIIIGRILPNSNIFKEGAFTIEIKLPSIYPLDPPKVRFLTPIYHPNVSKDGEFRDDLLQKTARWSNNTSLVDVIKCIVERIDQPDVDCPLNNEVTKEYTDNRDEFNRRALEIVKKHALPRN